MPDPTASPDHDSASERQFMLRSIYIKDLSFEAPNAPAIFQEEWKPETSLNLDIKLNKLTEDTHEIVLTVTVTAKIVDKTAYLTEVQQAGIVTVQGFEKQELGPLFYVYCPSILFPYARQAVTDLVSKGGFPHLVLQHIHFDRIYAQKLSEQQSRTSDEGGGSVAH
jgi:preprotein translocase subunit SecB